MSSSKPRDDPPTCLGPSTAGRHIARRRQPAFGGQTGGGTAALPRYLRSGTRSTRETVEYLRRRGVPLTQASRAVADCQRRGLLDDRACARLWADHWARRGYAWSAIRLKLAERGLDEPAIEHAASRLGMASSDDERARLAVAQRARPGDLPAPRGRQAGGRRQRARLARMLASRGFDQDLIERVLEESFGSDDG